MRHYHIAQINIALMRAPLSDPLMAGFVAELAHINATADASPGFVWRLQSEGGDATSIRAFEVVQRDLSADNYARALVD